MKPKILLINPPIYDFSAYDFWLKPLGLLTVASRLNSFADMTLYDYLDRLDPSLDHPKIPPDPFGRGPFKSEITKKPPLFSHIPRHYRRFGLPRDNFRRFLAKNADFNFALIPTTMTYWYPGTKEVIDDLRHHCPNVTIVLGGFYAQACPDHARNLGVDIAISTPDLSPLTNALKIPPQDSKTANFPYKPPFWQAYNQLKTAAMKLTTGCPFNCTYCWTGQNDSAFKHRPLDHCLADLQLLINKGVTDIAFYDDALLFQPEKLLKPFLEHIINNKIKANFHTPNALHAGLLNPDIAQLLVKAGFKTFYLGFESSSEAFHAKTGGKVSANQLESAVQNLVSAGAKKTYITAYQILGHPDSNLQQLETSMKFVNKLGIRIMLSDFSPLPNTPDGEKCRQWIDLDEPLNHNKTAFPIALLGNDKVNQIKDLRHKLNASLRT